MSLLATGIVAAYFAIMGCLALFGLHRLALVVLYLRHRRHGTPQVVEPGSWPRVTVQLPVYNERFVVRRLIDAVAGLDYPRECLEIQVLDDSSDATTALAAEAALYWQAQGVDVQHLRRADRHGFKAGALEYGLQRARGELIAVFDADFVPPADFLRRCVGEFSDPAVGMVQARWDHLNRGDSLLTSVQAMMLNGHFVVEHRARAASGRCFNFNGTAGVFRRLCIESAGGWEHDTLTEDLDLSYRAQLAGWRFVYRPDITAAAELPGLITAFKAQQYRWAKGSIQTARKLFWRVLRSSLPRSVRLEAAVHLLNNSAYLLLAALALLLPVAVLVRQGHGTGAALFVDLPLFAFASGSVGVFFLTGEIALGGRWWRRALVLPLLFALGVGMSVNNGGAVLAALLGRESPFLRTPKLAEMGQGSFERAAGAGYLAGLSWSVLIELGLAAYYGLAIVLAVERGYLFSLPWLVLFFTGFTVVGGTSLLESLRLGWAARVAPPTRVESGHLY